MTIVHALRSLKRNPLFAITVVLTLTLGLSAVGAMFAIVHGVLLAPLPYAQPDRLVGVGLHGPDLQRTGQPPALFATYRQFAGSLDEIGYYRTGSANLWSADAAGAAESAVATWVTASTFSLLRATPLLGRWFNADEERRGGPNAVILSEPEWRTRFGAAPDIIGRTLVVNSAPRQIVGVMPARFAFPTAATRVWLPVKLTDSGAVEDFAYSGVARLAPGADVAQAQSELAAALPRLAEWYPRLHTGAATATWLAEMNLRPVLTPLRDEFTGDIARTLWMLAAAAALVLLVAWASVVNLVLIRADGLQPELALRAALGAGRLRLATHFLGEALLLGATAALLALLVVHAAVALLVAFGPADIPRLAELGVGPVSVGFSALVALAGAVLCAAVATLRVRRASLCAQLHEGARGQSPARPRQRLRATISVLQIALTLVVTVGSALLLRTAQHLSAVHPGFESSGVTTLRLLLPYASYDGAANVAFYARLSERVRALPSVRAAGLTGQLPLGPGWTAQQAYSSDATGRTSSLPVNVVDDGYFATLQIPLLAGRGFRRLEVAQGGDVVISQRAVATLFGDIEVAAAVGRSLKLAPAGPTCTVVGVVGDVRYQDLAVPPSAMIYRPQGQPLDPVAEPGPRPSLVLVVSSGGPPDALVAAIRRIVRELDPGVPIFDVQAMDEVVRASTARQSLALALMTAAAAVSLLLGMVGLYGVVAYRVALRTREFGVRLALGADARSIARAVALNGLGLTAAGVAAGFGLHALTAPFLRAFLYGVSAGDPLTLAAATLVLAGTAMLASWIPARRAARIDPAWALRAE